MRNATVCFLVKKENNKITDVLLALKKRGFGVNLWNGAGGKVQEGEQIIDAAIRETFEEIVVKLSKKNMTKVAVIDFIFVDKPEWGQTVHAYITSEWEGEPSESEEMKPQWFKIQDIPYSAMWPDDEIWLPLVWEGKKLKAEFKFESKEEVKIVDQKIQVVDSL